MWYLQQSDNRTVSRRFAERKIIKESLELTLVARLGAIDEMLFNPTWIALIRGAAGRKPIPIPSAGLPIREMYWWDRIGWLTERNVSQADQGVVGQVEGVVRPKMRSEVLDQGDLQTCSRPSVRRRRIRLIRGHMRINTIMSDRDVSEQDLGRLPKQSKLTPKFELSFLQSVQVLLIHRPFRIRPTNSRSNSSLCVLTVWLLAIT